MIWPYHNPINDTHLHFLRIQWSPVLNAGTSCTMYGHAKSDLALAVPRLKVKTVKNALEAHNLLDKSVKIEPLPQSGLFRIAVKEPSGNVTPRQG